MGFVFVSRLEQSDYGCQIKPFGSSVVISAMVLVVIDSVYGAIEVCSRLTQKNRDYFMLFSLAFT